MYALFEAQSVEVFATKMDEPSSGSGRFGKIRTDHRPIEQLYKEEQCNRWGSFD